MPSNPLELIGLIVVVMFVAVRVWLLFPSALDDVPDENRRVCTFGFHKYDGDKQ